MLIDKIGLFVNKIYDQAANFLCGAFFHPEIQENPFYADLPVDEIGKLTTGIPGFFENHKRT